MSRSALVGALLALLGTALVVPPAAAEPPPLVVAFGGGDSTLSEVEPFTVSNISESASYIGVTYAGRQLTALKVEGAAAAGQLETWGLAGSNDLVLAECTDAEATECGESLTLATTVTNPDPTYDLSRPGTEFSLPFDYTVHLAHTSGSPSIRATSPDAAPQFVDLEVPLPVDTAALSEGPHQIALEVCSEDHLRCSPAQPVTFTVVRTVPGKFSVAAAAFSPNGDGLFDRLRFTYSQGVPWDSAEIVIRNAAAAEVFHSSVPLPQAPSNDGFFSFNGKATGGGVLPDGSYTAVLTATRVLASGDPVAWAYAAKTFKVDTKAQAPATLTPSFPTFYPYVDGYRDAVRFAYAGAESYARIDLKVRNAAGTLVRSKRVLSSADATWNGKRTNGTRAPEGRYSARLRVVDRLGNVGLSPTTSVTLRDARIVWFPRSLTVTPESSRVDGQTGACSTRRAPSLHGWTGSTGYLSNTTCQSGFEASTVWTLHRVQLQKAPTYRRVRLGWYGGPTRAATHDRASASIYDVRGISVGWVSTLDYLASQYITQSFRGSRVVDKGHVEFGFQTDSGNRYDVKSFTVAYEVGLLR